MAPWKDEGGLRPLATHRPHLGVYQNLVSNGHSLLHHPHAHYRLDPQNPNGAPRKHSKKNRNSDRTPKPKCCCSEIFGSIRNYSAAHQRQALVAPPVILRFGVNLRRLRKPVPESPVDRQSTSFGAACHETSGGSNMKACVQGPCHTAHDKQTYECGQDFAPGTVDRVQWTQDLLGAPECGKHTNVPSTRAPRNAPSVPSASGCSRDPHYTWPGMSGGTKTVHCAPAHPPAGAQATGSKG